jgi:hypothetical protein
MVMYIQIPNVLTVDGKEKLSGEELYLYYYLCLHECRWFNNKIVMSIDTLSHQFSVMKNENQNKDRLESILRSLREKCVIIFDDIELSIKKKFKFNIPMTIYKQPDTYYLGRDDHYMNGYEKIDIKLFDRINHVPAIHRGNYFLVCCYIQKVKREVSYLEWSNVLGYDEKQVRNIIYNMDRLGLIHRNSGRYYMDGGSTKQEINNYIVVDDVDLGTLNKNSKKYGDNDIIQTVYYSDITIGTLLQKATDSNWGMIDDSPGSNGHKRLDYDDYELYRLCLDYGVNKKFVIRCRNTLNSIKKYDSYDGCFEIWEDKYLKDKIELELG